MTTIRPAYLVLALICGAMFFNPASGRALEGDPPAPKRRVLLVTGEDYPGHKWRPTAPALLAELLKVPVLVVDVLADLASLGTARLDDYHAVVVHFKNYDPHVPGRRGYENLAGFVERGGGLMLVHFACGAFEEFKDDFVHLAGRVWFGMKPPPGKRQHDPHGPFTVRITEPDHPITRGLADFETVDELYTCLEGDPAVTTLASATSKVDGRSYPMAFVHEYGKGHVFHTVLGHDVAAFTAQGPAELHRRGCAWVAGLDPAAP